MKEHEPTGSLYCYWTNTKDHPKCIHGPTLLFGREQNGEINKFYACSACRDRKLCSFYAEHGKHFNKNEKQILEQDRKKNLPSYNHQKLFIYYNQLMGEQPGKRIYCHTCERLLLASEKVKHNDHQVTENLSDYQMTHPSEILKPLEDSKKEAQYLFSKKAVTDIINLLVSLNAENVLCIGAPRIHEYITQNLEGKMSSLLLDFDGRFHNFFGPLNYCWYNLFNHYFFQENSEDVFKDFLKQNNGKNLYLVCDPPFGGRVEPISQTMKIISDTHKKLNKICESKDEIKFFFIFPYFMEAVIKEKSNPPNICGGLKDLKMTDYKVEYDNHPLFVSKANNQQQGSQVRLYTNIPLGLIKLPESDGYKYCKRCDRWVARENRHCKICKQCTSKDGRRYRHCKLCQRCVKPTWQHCKVCDRCLLPSHKCGQKPKIGSCFKCNTIGHTEKECPSIATLTSIEKVTLKKRKNKSNNDNSSLKKQKLETEQNNLKSEKREEDKLSRLKYKDSKINETNLNKKVLSLSKLNKLNKKKEKKTKVLKSTTADIDDIKETEINTKKIHGTTKKILKLSMRQDKKKISKDKKGKNKVSKVLLPSNEHYNIKENTKKRKKNEN